MDLFQVDVFAEEAYSGNPLAVFPDAAELSSTQMQTLAREMNLSETIFVRSIQEASYEVRIFTPTNELPFAGHPTIGCAWLLSEIGLIEGDVLTQHSPAGATTVRRVDGEFWFDRGGDVNGGFADVAVLSDGLGLELEDLTMEWEGVELHPAVVDAGVPQLIVPIKDGSTLESIQAPAPFKDERHWGPYCFTRTARGITARGFFPDLGIPEDPATGSAAAALGVYLDHHVGPVEAEITQGAQINRRSVIRMRAREGTASIGGSCRRILKGTMEALP